MNIEFTKSFYGTKIHSNGVILGWVNSSVNNSWIFQNSITEENVKYFSSYEEANEYAISVFNKMTSNFEKIKSAIGL